MSATTWQASTDGFATFNNILSNTENYQHPTGITTTTQFRRVDVSELNGQTCSDTTVPVTVSVNAPPVGNLLVNGAARFSALQFVLVIHPYLLLPVV